MCQIFSPHGVRGHIHVASVVFLLHLFQVNYLFPSSEISPCAVGFLILGPFLGATFKDNGFFFFFLLISC